MEIWQWLKGIGSATHKGRSNRKQLDPRIAQAFSRVKRNIKTLKTDLADTNARLARQNSRIAKNTRQINNHNAQLDQLEDIVSAASLISSLPNNPTNRPSQLTSRPSQPTNRLVATKPSQVESLERLDMASITEQEKRIIGVFLAHRDMSLSYRDIAKSLDKSPYTVKNQMRQINMKAGIFDRTIDSQNKNRFKLRKYLKVEANLDAD